jgi:hypothetical protein
MLSGKHRSLEMLQVKAHENPGGHSAVISVDGIVVGGIKIAGRTYRVDTSGKIPAIDGISGTTPQDAWNNVLGRARTEAIIYYVELKAGDYESA